MTFTREYTINLHKRLHKIGYKKRGRRSIAAIRKFASDLTKVKDVRIETALNKAIWSRGVKNVPFRIRVRLTKKRNHDDEATEKFFILVSYVPVESFKGLITRNVDNVEADE